MKLIVQIPCNNEEKTLPETLEDIPRDIKGFDEVKVLVIDDGSTDRTAEVAWDNGADHVIRLTTRKGLAAAFSEGIDACLDLGADIIVNTDGDHQYKGEDIPRLVQLIVEGKAEMVIGCREVSRIEHFPWLKKKLELLGSWVTRKLSGTEVPDVTSGFRAYSRKAAIRMNVFSTFTYTLETIIQAGIENVDIGWIDVHVNQVRRRSRLFSSKWAYVKKSAATLIRIYTTYQPLKVFLIIGSALMGLGFLLGLRFLFFVFTERSLGHVQSLILVAILSIIGFQVIVLGVIADLISVNRRLIAKALRRVRELEIDLKKGA